jgi:hypothetical protein
LADKNDVELNVDLQEFKDSFQNDEAEKEPISCEVALNDLSPQSESSETQGLIPQNASSSLAWFQNFIDELQLEPLRILFSPEYRLTTILLW